MSTPITPDRQAKAHAIRTDFEYFARTCVKIQTKKPGEVLPLNIKRSQRMFLDAVYMMMHEVGMVRLIIVKGRQQGISTVIEMFLFWLSLFVANTKVCIISHEAKSTAALFDKVAFAHKNLPPEIRPKLLTSNRNELKLENDSTYMVLTAGSEESGRSQTAHHQHQSERAFFENAEAIDAGAGQIVADMPGTYVFKESTGNGTNHFYFEVLDAVEGKGIYRYVFIPWFVEEDYRTKPKANFTPDDDEIELAETYHLDWHQLQWRRDKIVELKSLKKFRQEYPCTLMEAFQASGNAFYNPDSVARARASRQDSNFGPIIIGVDPARTGDRTVITWRRGREIKILGKYDTMDNERLTGILSNIIKSHDPDKIFIDMGMGTGPYDRLCALGFSSIVSLVNFGGSADDDVYLNKRAEMAHRFKAWLEEEGEVRLPDDDDVAADIASMPEPVPTSSGKLKFPSKDDIRKNFGRSPDILDSIMLTFAYYVAADGGPKIKVYHTKATRKGSALDAMAETRPNDNYDASQYDSTWYDTGTTGGVVRKPKQRLLEDV